MIEETTLQEEGLTPNPKVPFRITDQSSAEWALFKIHERRQRRILIEAQAAAMIAEARKAEEAAEARFLPELEAWAKEQIDSGAVKGKTVKTFAGALSLRTVPGRFAVDKARSEELALLHCPDAIEVIETRRVDSKALIEALKAHLEATGEIVEGFEIVPARESLSVKFLDER